MKELKSINYRARVHSIPLSSICSISDGLLDIAFETSLLKSLTMKGMINPLLVCTEEDFKNTDIRQFERRRVPEVIEQEYRCLIGNNRYAFAVKNGYTHIDCLIVSGLEELKSLHRETQISPRKM